jgi:hypothetical protein
MSAHQSDLFGARTPVSPLIGFRVRLPDTCRCGAATAVVGAGKGPHAGELKCAVCERHRGWLSKDFASFIASITKKFGAPTTPIVLRHRVPHDRVEEPPGNAGITKEELRNE